MKSGLYRICTTVCSLYLLSSSRIQLAAQTKPDTIRIAIKAIAGMQYDLVRFSIKPGSYINLILTNADEMEHNLVFGKKDSRQKIVDAALALGKDGPSIGYIPKVPEVLASIRVLNSNETDSILFRAPRATGVYPYVCSFPGHGGIMYGAMHVTQGLMPELNADIFIPPHRRKTESISHKIRPAEHPYSLIPPYLYRVLMPDAGPAAIAVCLPNKINYCWDAGSCRLRYIWTGAFLDLSDYWTIKGELNAKILGSIIYKGKTQIQSEMPKGISKVRFKGYKLIDGYPEFNYFLDKMEILEHITSQVDDPGIIRQFKISNIHRPVRFIYEDYEGIIFKSDKGIWEGNQLYLQPNEATHFTITMQKKNQ